MKMRWGRKKSGPSPSRSSIIARMFPVSWISRSRKKSGDPGTTPASKQDFPTPDSSLRAFWREGRFYSMGSDDAYWRLSFSEERIEGRRSTGGINPLWKDSDDKFQVPVSRFQSFDLGQMEVPGRETNRSFGNMVFHVKKMKEKEHSSALRGRRPNAEAELIMPRRKDVNGRRSRNPSTVGRKNGAEFERRSADGEEKYSETVERDIFPIEPENMVQNLEKKKFKEIKIKAESQMRSADTRREVCNRKMQQSRIKSYSPRTECRIRVLEDMKKARMMLKKKGTMAESRNIFDRFAVVKNSFNPQLDFRDSMIEMINEKGITRPEELEELLACYLTLNCDEHHDLIIKIFQQVWFELNGVCTDPAYAVPII